MLCHVALDGRCFGTPVAYNGKLYLQTTRHLYCWGKKGDNPGLLRAAGGKAVARGGTGDAAPGHPFGSAAAPG